MSDDVYQQVLSDDDLEWITEDDDGGKTLELEYPFSVSVKQNNRQEDCQISEIRLRRPRVSELELLSTLEKKNVDEIQLGRRFATALIVEPGFIKDRHILGLDMDDGRRLMATAFSFLPPPEADSGSVDQTKSEATQ